MPRPARAGLALMVLTLVSSGCGDDPGPAPRSRLVVGEATPLAQQEVPATGGTIAVERAGDPMDGLRIEVPSGAYDTARTFRISTAPIRSHGFGRHFTPRSPRVRVENGGGRSREPMVLRIPVSIPAGHVAAGFLYDETNERLEGLALLEHSPTSITVATSHFSDVVVGSAAEADLAKESPIRTKFEIGVDSWQFANLGVHGALGGICSGMTLSAMWYFEERKPRGEKALHGRYDGDGSNPTPKFWEDDGDAIRLCGRLQREQWHGVVARTMRFTALSPELTWNLFRLVMLTTSQPQLVAVRRTDPTEGARGHALVAWQIEHDRIRVYDPDFPADKDRFVLYENGAFRPYKFGPDPGVAYPSIGYLPKTSLLKYEAIAKAFGEMGTPAGRALFPEFELRAVIDEQDVPLVDGAVLSSDVFELRAENRERQVAPWRAFDGGQKEIGTSRRPLELEPGRQRIGVLVGDGPWWFDFRWVDVTVKVDPEKRIRAGPLEGGTSVDLRARELGKSRFRLVTEPDGKRTLLIEVDQDTPAPYALAVADFKGVAAYPLNPPPFGDARTVWKEAGAVWAPVLGGTLYVQEWTESSLRLSWQVTFKNPSNGHTRAVKTDAWFKP